MKVKRQTDPGAAALILPDGLGGNEDKNVAQCWQTQAHEN